ncbi:IclR family transcriptional regulator domain-containing protein [Bradyrhizobium centrolobii]|nr:IclR family transcriptional regulator C-terminal domain-containing protein [Bradyrhizobium centrolobii]
MDITAPDGRDKEQLSSFIRGLAVIEIFSERRRRLSITEVAEAASTTKATARRILRSLVASGYADFDGHTFSLTPRVLRLGYAYLSSQTIIQLAEPVLRELRSKSGLSATMSVLDGEEIVIVARAPTNQLLTIRSDIGSRLPAFCTSMGRAMLSSLPDAEIERIIRSERTKPLAPKTETDPKLLTEIVKEIQRRGYSLVDQEIERGLISMAMPVRNARVGRCYAVCVSAHTSQMNAKDLPKKALNYLREAVRTLDTAS